MGMADVATVLFSRHLKFDPKWPEWPDRDRFVLSAGHGSMLLYAILFLTGYREMTLEQIRKFRQRGSKTPGHPEYDLNVGIETTTGPLGQGLANAVGMALAERMLYARFGNGLVDHWTYVIAGDGCLMEGISHEAASLAGHLQLGKLIVLFDDNGITIDGPTKLSTSEDIPGRFTSLGWHTESIDGHDPNAIYQAIAAAKQSPQPSLIACQTIIGFGAPNKQGTASAHGSPLGDEEIAKARTSLNWPHQPFEIPDPVMRVWREAGTRASEQAAQWRKTLKNVSAKTRKEWEFFHNPDLGNTDDLINEYKRKLVDKQSTIATRKASQDTLEVLNQTVTMLIGGSADLTGSNNTRTSNLDPVTSRCFGGRYIHFGVREHGMAAAMNGIALHGGFVPYGGTFLVFTDYLRPALRLSALMKQRVIYVMTHDSIGLGEDGPTHQPVEHLASLRAMSNLLVFRPADATETAECWAAALAARNSPSVIALTRQGLEPVRKTYTAENLCAKGGYELAGPSEDVLVTLIATGSEVNIALLAQRMLRTEGIPARVVSMPCWELFDLQDGTYKDKTLGPNTVRIAIEAGSRLGWDRYIGETGDFVGMASFGESGPYEDLYQHFGITPEEIVASTLRILSKKS